MFRRWGEEPSGSREIRSRLRGGTSLERIGDESLTLADSGFVHGYMWIFGWRVSPHAESLNWPDLCNENNAVNLCRGTIAAPRSTSVNIMKSLTFPNGP